MNGWMGNLLRVNLTDRTSSVESSEKYFKYIGGKGMANRIMYDEVPADTKPEAPENKLVFDLLTYFAGTLGKVMVYLLAITCVSGFVSVKNKSQAKTKRK